MDKYLVYTNITGSSNVPEIESYLGSSGYNFNFETMYYKHSVADHSQYTKVFALVDTSCPVLSDELKTDVKRKCEILRKKGVRIVLCNLWESHDHVAGSPWANILRDFDFDCWHGGVSFFWHMMFYLHKDRKYKFYHVHKPYDFLYLTKSERSHRNMLYDKLKKTKILDHCIYSYHAKKKFLDLDYELPGVTEYPSYGMDQLIYEKPYNETKFSIVSETSDKEIFFTEKIWKPIIAQQIFIVHGAIGYLKILENLGFQTYSDFIDESYDSVSGEEKIDKIVDLCKCLKDTKHIELYWKTKNIREKNRSIFFDEKSMLNAVRSDVSSFIV